MNKQRVTSRKIRLALMQRT